MSLVINIYIKFISHRVFNGYTNDERQRTIKTRRRKVSKVQPGKTVQFTETAEKIRLSVQAKFVGTGFATVKL